MRYRFAHSVFKFNDDSEFELCKLSKSFSSIKIEKKRIKLDTTLLTSVKSVRVKTIQTITKDIGVLLLPEFLMDDGQKHAQRSISTYKSYANTSHPHIRYK